MRTVVGSRTSYHAPSTATKYHGCIKTAGSPLRSPVAPAPRPRPSTSTGGRSSSLAARSRACAVRPRGRTNHNVCQPVSRPPACIHVTSCRSRTHDSLPSRDCLDSMLINHPQSPPAIAHPCSLTYSPNTRACLLACAAALGIHLSRQPCEVRELCLRSTAQGPTARAPRPQNPWKQAALRQMPHGKMRAISGDHMSCMSIACL